MVAKWLKMYFVTLATQYNAEENKIISSLKPYYLTSSANQAHYCYLALSVNKIKIRKWSWFVYDE